PAGLTRLSHDMHLRAVYDRVPPPPPNHFKGDDRITIHEDTNGDGTFDHHKIFVDGHNLVSSVAIGRGGVWVLNPPYLLFYADRDRDDLPDGDPEVHLEGFGLEDSHSIANSLRWGPDGWLYGAQGSTVTGNIRRPGSGGNGVRTMGQLIWRYHPENRHFEVFAEGGGNTFGVEIDAKGRIYSGHNGGNTRGFHYVQGGYYLKGFGKHGQLSNPNAFGYFNAMRHGEVPRFTHTFIVYEGSSLPARYDGKLFGVEPLQGRVVYSEIQPDGSSFRTSDLGHPIQTEDSWFRPVDIQAGPDGAIYVADFYEQRIDHSSHYQGRIHRESGRIYRLKNRVAERNAKFDVARLPTPELISLLDHKNKWFRQTALRVFGDRKDTESIPIFRKLMIEESEQVALEALWALNLAGGFSDSVALDGIAHHDPYVRIWSIRLACDDFEMSEAIANRLALLARSEPNVEVRSQLACSARRVSARATLPIIRELLMRQEDALDVHVPLLLWWAIESKVDTDRAAVLNLVRDGQVWNSPLFREHIAERLMRRLISGGKNKDYLDCIELLRLSDGVEMTSRLLSGLNAAFEGRSMTGLPAELSQALSAVEGVSLIPRLRQGEAAAIDEALAVVRKGGRGGLNLIQILEVLGQLRIPSATPVLLSFIRGSSDDIARRAALSSLAAYNRPEIGGAVLEVYESLPPPVREAAQVLLVRRLVWAQEFLAALESGRVSPLTVSAAVKRNFLLFGDSEIKARVTALWPDLNSATSDSSVREMQRIQLAVEVGLGNPYNGKTLYGNLCGVCHTLFAEGRAVGPDLTSYQRGDLQALLLNIVSPNAEIREGYEQYVITTIDQQTVNGFMVDQSASVVVLRASDGQNIALPRNEIETIRAEPNSLMPEGLLNSLTDEEIRDFFAYLRSSQPLPD
ncbi:MAG: c-type cytochrome, partial [Verrucomicrobia bacterium]|nr:c-type cytochrome [Verrucomicrobiota bacterium]